MRRVWIAHSRFARGAATVVVATLLLACGGKTDESAAPCPACGDASLDVAAIDTSTADVDAVTRDTQTGLPDSRDADMALDAGRDAEVGMDADACVHYSETATCCEGSVSYGPELTKCPGVTCRVAYYCTRGSIYEDHDACFFARCDTGVDTADVADADDAADAPDGP